MKRLLIVGMMVALAMALLLRVYGANAMSQKPQGATTDAGVQNSAPALPSDPPAVCGQMNIVPSPNVIASGTGNRLQGVSALSGSDAWAVGYYYNGNYNQTLVEHWDGTAWSVVTSPNASDDNGGSNLLGVSAVASNDVWAAGYYVSGGVSLTLVEHWDGSSWSVVSSPSPSGFNNPLNSVSALAGNDVWAVGADFNGNADQTLMEHWDGTAWSVVPSPNVGTHNNFLSGVAALASNDVWAVGDYQDASGVPSTLVEHWNGTAWSVVPSLNPGTDGSRLRGVSVLASNDVWAVGDYQNSGVFETLVEHWNGTTWSVITSQNPGNSGNYLYGVSAVASNDVWAAGYYVGAFQTLVEHWDGTAWSVVSSPNAGTSNDDFLNGVSALPNGDVWTAGYYGNPSQTGNPGQTLVEKYGGPCGGPASTPTATSSVVPGQFNDVAASSPFYPFVTCLVNRQILSGYPCGGAGEPCPGSYFRPNDSVTRGQIAKIISNAAGYTELFPDSTQSFADVPSSSPFWIFVERVHLHGAVSGYGCGGAGEPCPGAYFRPSAPLTRGQLAKIATSVAGYSDPPPINPTFVDVPPSNPFYGYIEQAHTHNIISGYGCGGAGEPCPGTYFRPGLNVTRGQTAKIVSGTFFPGCTTSLRK